MHFFVISGFPAKPLTLQCLTSSYSLIHGAQNCRAAVRFAQFHEQVTQRTLLPAQLVVRLRWRFFLKREGRVDIAEGVA
jgi:hypothetical protein